MNLVQSRNVLPSVSLKYYSVDFIQSKQKGTHLIVEMMSEITFHQVLFLLSCVKTLTDGVALRYKIQ